jgi:EAL domain-containing protein (putative c-di-GMP-specific phosphodiesterase class I)
VLEEHSLISDRPNLFLEITERSLANYKIIAPHFMRSKERAIGAFIDDFGVEQSGFIQVAKVLNLFPSTDYVKVKLDIEFARNLADPAYRWFAKSVIASMRDCPSGKIDVIVEGIEEHWQRDLFKEYGAKYGQGWLWGKPEQIAVK